MRTAAVLLIVAMIAGCSAQVEDSVWRAERAEAGARDDERRALASGDAERAAAAGAVADRLAAEIERVKRISARPDAELGSLGALGGLAGLAPWGAAAAAVAGAGLAELRRRGLAKGLDSLVDAIGAAKERSPGLAAALKENEESLDRAYAPVVHARIAARRAARKASRT